MGSIDLTRCDWCGFPLAQLVEDGCVAENCSMRPMPELTERGQMRQAIRRLLAATDTAEVALTGGTEFISEADALEAIREAREVFRGR